MTSAANHPIAHTSPQAVEENLCLEGLAFCAAHMAEGAEMWFPDRLGVLRGAQILVALKTAPRWEGVVFDHQEVEVVEGRITLRTPRDRTARPPGRIHRVLHHHQCPRPGRSQADGTPPAPGLTPAVSELRGMGARRRALSLGAWLGASARSNATCLAGAWAAAPRLSKVNGVSRYLIESKPKK